MSGGKRGCDSSEGGRIATGRHAVQLRVLLTSPALLMLAASPLSAAIPRMHLVAMCTGNGPQLILAEGEDPAKPSRDGGDPAQMGCAHALCPRAALPDRKARCPG